MRIQMHVCFSVLTCLLVTPYLSTEFSDLHAQTTREFVVGDVAKLKVRHLKKTGLRDKGKLIVEVTNRERFTAEPLEFIIEYDPKVVGENAATQTFKRGGIKTWGCAGLGILPAGKRRFTIPLPIQKKMKIRISRASFFKGKGETKCPAKILSVKDVESYDDFTSRKIKKTEIRLKNNSHLAICVFLQAFDTKWKNLRLVQVFLKAKQTVIVGENRDLERRFFAPPSNSVFEGQFSKVKIVDWLTFQDIDHDIARKSLKLALANRQRLPLVDGQILTTTFDYFFEAPNTLKNQKGRATCTWSKKQSVKIKDVEAISESARYELGITLNSLFANLTWPSLAEIELHATVELLNSTAKDGIDIWLKPKQKNKQHPFFEVVRVAKGQVTAATKNPAVFNRDEITWDQSKHKQYATQVQSRIERPYSISGPIAQSKPKEVLKISHKSYDKFSAPETVIRRFVPAMTNLNVGRTLNGQVRLDFRSFEISDAAAPQTVLPIRGDGIAGLRAAWEKPYHYPNGSVALKGSLTIDAKTTSANWQNRKKLEGKITATKWDGKKPNYLVFKFDPEKYSKSGKDAVNEMLADHLSIWTGKDFCNRKSFDLEFRGCEIRHSKTEDCFDILGHQNIITVKTSKGLPTQISYRDGIIYTIRFNQQAGQLVPVETNWIFNQTWTGSFRTTYSKINKDWSVPSKIEIKDWFGTPWGPETFTFRFSR